LSNLGAMTLLEFNELNLDQKAAAVWHGTFLADREKNGFIVQLLQFTKVLCRSFL